MEGKYGLIVIKMKDGKEFVSLRSPSEYGADYSIKRETCYPVKENSKTGGKFKVKAMRWGVRIFKIELPYG